MKKRLPKDNRVSTNPVSISPGSLEERVLLSVRRHRFIRASHLAILESNLDSMVLDELVQEKFLRLPKAQYRYGVSKRGLDLVYGLGSKGIRYLHKAGYLASARMQEKEVREIYLEHTLLITDFMVCLEISLPKETRILYEDSLAPKHVGSVSWRIPIRYGAEKIEIGVIPDRVFGLKTGDSLQVFCLEADRGTMPVKRKNPRQTSFYRKILAYRETWKSEVLGKKFGWSRFRVLTITSSKSRCDHLVRMCAETTKGGGSGLFLFADSTAYKASGSVFHMEWTLGNGLHPVKLTS